MSGFLTGACAAHTRRPAPAGASFPHSRRRARSASISDLHVHGESIWATSCTVGGGRVFHSGDGGNTWHDCSVGCPISPSTRSPSTSAIHACGWEPTAECGRAVTTAPPGRRSLQPAQRHGRQNQIPRAHGATARRNAQPGSLGSRRGWLARPLAGGSSSNKLDGFSICRELMSQVLSSRGVEQPGSSSGS